MSNIIEGLSEKNYYSSDNHDGIHKLIRVNRDGTETLVGVYSTKKQKEDLINGKKVNIKSKSKKNNNISTKSDIENGVYRIKDENLSNIKRKYKSQIDSGEAELKNDSKGWYIKFSR